MNLLVLHYDSYAIEGLIGGHKPGRTTMNQAILEPLIIIK